MSASWFIGKKLRKNGCGMGVPAEESKLLGTQCRAVASNFRSSWSAVWGCRQVCQQEGVGQRVSCSTCQLHMMAGSLG